MQLAFSNSCLIVNQVKSSPSEERCVQRDTTETITIKMSEKTTTSKKKYKIDGDRKKELASAESLPRKHRKELPSVQELLIHGARDENDPPETFLRSLIYPGILLLVFCFSLFIFHIAPHDKSVGVNPTLPQMGRNPPVQKVPDPDFDFSSGQ